MSTVTRPRPATFAARDTARAAPAASVARAAPATRVALPAPLRLAHAARGLPDSAFIDRLLAGRVWVAVVAVALIGIVFMQVSLLRLNSAIGEAVERQAALERHNAALRADVSGLSAGPRIQEVAAGLGMVMPPAGEVRYLDVTGRGPTLLGDRAAHGMVAPSAEAVATAQEGASPETRAAAAASADAPPGTTPATGGSLDGPVTPPSQAAGASVAQAPAEPGPADGVPAPGDPYGAPVDPAVATAAP